MNADTSRDCPHVGAGIMALSEFVEVVFEINAEGTSLESVDSPQVEAND